MRSLVASLVTLVLLSVDAVTPRKPQNFQLCGDRLAQTLSLICDGNFNGPSKHSSNSKRTMDMSMDMTDPEAEPRWTPEEFGGPVLVLDHSLDRAQALGLLKGLTGLRRVRRAERLVDECCYKPCTLSELTSYCSVETTVNRL